MAEDYLVYVDDNFHYMDEGERYLLGSFPTCEEAVQVSKKIVDDFLLDTYKPGMTDSELCSLYTGFGDDPFIIAPPGSPCRFSAWDYAREQCRAICGS